jgi:hypothetical protein
VDPIGNRRLQIFRTLTARFPAGRLLDLSAGHGRFSQTAADAGWRVTAVDARGDRFPDDHRVDWVVGDVRDVQVQGYDLIACLGLFYHLTLEDQLSLLARCAGTALVLDTHVDNGRPTQPLSGPVELGEYRGRLFGEELQYSTAAWGNEQSFWPDLESFQRMLASAGYGVVLECAPWYVSDRTFWLALPSA